MRCRRCNCRVKGDGARCAYETDWLEHRDYFCSSPGCQKHMAAPTPSTLCPDCERDIRPWQVAKLAKAAEQSKKHVRGECQCGARLSKRGYCYACKKWSEIHPF